MYAILNAPNPHAAMQTPNGAAARSGLMTTGPAPRLPGSTESTELAAMVLRSLDHVGRGMLLVAAGGRVLHANRLAMQALDASHPLQLREGRLQARDPADAQRLDAALQAGLQRGLRHLLPLGGGEHGATVAVLPIDAGGSAAVLVSLEQPRRGQDMAVQWYARQHSLTSAETGVLEALLDGLSPVDIAGAKRVALSTVRTQIGQLRLKTGARSIRQLLDRVGGLPPMMVVVQ